MKLALVCIISVTICIGCVIDDSFFYTLENEETIQLNADRKSGSYLLRFSITDFLNQSKNQLVQQNPGIRDIRIDTIIELRNSLQNVSSDLTAIEREMFDNGSVRVMADFSTMTGDVLIKLFFKRRDMLSFQRTHILEFIKNNISFAMISVLAPKMKPELQQTGNPSYPINFKVEVSEDANDEKLSMAGLNPFGKTFSFQITDEGIFNKFVDSSYHKRTLKSIDFINQHDDIMTNLEKISCKTTFVLPGKIKKYSGQVESINTDKEIITFKNSVADIYKNPKLLEFSVQY